MTPGQFVKELTGSFYPPQKWDEEIADNWSRRITREVAEFPAEVRQRALDQLMRDAETRSMPILRDILIACRNAQRFLDMKANRNKLPIEVQSAAGYIDQSRKILARQLMRTVIGRRALEEGWHGPMYSHILATGRAPGTPEEQRKCQLAAVETMELISEIESGVFTCKYTKKPIKIRDDLKAAQVSFYNSILKRWDEAREMVTAEPDIPVGITEDVT